MESPLRQISAASAAAVCVSACVCVQNHGRAPQTLRAQFVTADFLRASHVFIYLFVFSFFHGKKVETGRDTTQGVL